MPELPEVEHLRRTLEPRLIGAKILAVDLRRRDVVRDCGGKRRGEVSDADLLAGARIARLMRHGKNLAIVGDRGRVICVHLGMSGQLFLRTSAPTAKRSAKGVWKHEHCVWRLRSANGRASMLVFRDPRRFGGLWLFDSIESLQACRWEYLGPDALLVTARQLHRALHGARRSVKAALLDQGALAGVGNIYADEALFLAQIHPLSQASSLAKPQTTTLARSIRTVLKRAIDAGGSSIRSYVDGNGNAGEFTLEHRVYGRGEAPCFRCGSTLVQTTVAQRTTVFCTRCQRRFC